MKNKFFINKFLPILSIFLLVVFIFTSSVFGYSATFDCCLCDGKNNLVYPDGVSRYTSDNPEGKHFNNAVLFYNNDTLYLMISCSYDSRHGTEKLYFNDNGVVVTSPSPYMYVFIKYDSNTDSWAYDSYNTSLLTSNSSIYSSSSDIYTDSSLTDVFFQSAPLGITKTLVEETEKVQIAEQLRTMIVGFLKYLIALVISVIAFYKGWKFLSTQLKRS